MTAPELIVIGFEDEPSSPPAAITQWKPPAISKAAIDEKTKLAALRKEKELASKTAKASKFTQKSTRTYHLKKAQDEKGIAQTSKALETKISRAESRRSSLTTRIVAKLASKSKKNKLRKARLSEEDSDKVVEIARKASERLADAESRRSSQQAKEVAKVVQVHQHKIVAAAEAKHASLTLAQDKGEILEQRLAAAQTRKKLLLAEQMDTLAKSHQDKAARVQEVRELEVHRGRDGSARLANKVQAADGRRTKGLMEKLPADTAEDKATRAEALKVRELEAAVELSTKNTSKLEAATERRAKVLQERSNKVAVKAQATAKRLESQKTSSDVATVHLRDMLDEKMARAEENRHDHLATIVQRSSTSTNSSFSSPAKSPASSTAIDRKLKAAAARRDMHLAAKRSNRSTSTSIIAGNFPYDEEGIGGNLLPAVSGVRLPPTKKPRLSLEVQGELNTGEGEASSSGQVVAKGPRMNIFVVFQGWLGGMFQKLIGCFLRK